MTDDKLMERANLYAREVARSTSSIRGTELAEVDLARAFVIGFAAGVEAAPSYEFSKSTRAPGWRR